jgi:cobaltochelatase CobN
MMSGLALFLCCSFALAKPLSVVLIPGDPATMTTISAIKQLRQEATLNEVNFRILPFTQLSESDLASLADADVGLVYNMGREIATTITPAIEKMKTRGAKAYAIGSVFDENEKRAGLTQDETLRAYSQAGGSANLAAMIKRVLARDFGYPLQYSEPTPFPMHGLWNPHNGKTFGRFDDFAADYLSQRPDARGKAWVSILFNRPTAQAGSSLLLESMTEALEERGLNVVPVFGYPSDVPVKNYLLDEQGRSRVSAVVGLALKLGNTPEKTIPVMKLLDVPVINAISMLNQSPQEWEASPTGLSLTERSWQVSLAEFAGALAPTVVAGKERRRDSETGLVYIAEVPIPERIGRLADRIRKWLTLQEKSNLHKRVAVIYYNYPAGKENIGAAYLNVLPRSLWQILSRLEKEGYDVQGHPATEDALFDVLHDHGTNIGHWAPGALEQLVRGNNAMLLSVSDYRTWFDQLPAQLRKEVIDAWGQPEESTVMVWKDANGLPYFVFPAQRFGNLVFAPQPSRGWEGEPEKMAHDMALPPHHQYLAFYLWLQNGFRADAMIHVGTHATHEWLSGKEIGFTNADPSEALVTDVPQLYPYIVDDIGEALQAKRRGMAATISYMTPPFDKATLNQELRMLKGLIDDYSIARQKSEAAAQAKLIEINAQAKQIGILKDIGLTTVKDGEDVDKLEEYFEEISNHQAPYGLHTLGVAPPEALRLTTADASLSVAGKISAEDYERRKQELAALMVKSAANELNALVAGLSGRHVVAGPGGDPIRNPQSLPSGRNLYGFDPMRMPSPGIWEQGKALAEKFIADYRQHHDQFPDRIAFTLWSIETMSHEGVTEAEILALMGVKPLWDERGRIAGLEVIPRSELGRPRVDVTITPSGLYRDTLPNLMLLLDDAVSKVKDLAEEDNPIRENVHRTRAFLEQKGVPPADAERMAAVRIFTEPTGAYGSGIENIVQASNTWNQESQVADVYFNRLGHLFGQGYWGARPGGNELAVDVFKMALAGVKATILSRSSNLIATLDNDDVYQYLGASAMAIRQVDGKTPETYILNLADSKAGKHETVYKYMGREMRTRYTNPDWIKAMLKEGYAGARFIMTVTDNLWGWQVTVPEVVDGAKWQEMYETYVADRNDLGIKERFRKAQNLLAYQALVDKMLVAINKGYWQAAPSVKAHLEQVNREVIAEAGVACNALSCSSPEVTTMAQAQDRQAMDTAKAMPAPDIAVRSAMNAVQSTASELGLPPLQVQAKPASAETGETNPADSSFQDKAQVEGYEIKEQSGRQVLPAEAAYGALFGMLLLVLAGFLWRAHQHP